MLSSYGKDDKNELLHIILYYLSTPLSPASSPSHQRLSDLSWSPNCRAKYLCCALLDNHLVVAVVVALAVLAIVE
jgi:hypothetical protein